MNRIWGTGKRNGKDITVIYEGGEFTFNGERDPELLKEMEKALKEGPETWYPDDIYDPRNIIEAGFMGVLFLTEA